MTNKTQRKLELLRVIYAAAVNTRARPTKLRGPYVISDEDLDAVIAVSEKALARYEREIAAAHAY
jgi:hypothetical protein